MTLFGIPIGYLVILASRQMVSLYDGQTWPNRIIGFVFGIVFYRFMYPIVLEINGIYTI